MAKTKISEYSSTAGNNTDINSINLAEGMAPSLVNNAIRQLMAQLKNFQDGSAGDNVTVGGNLAVTGTSTLTGAITATGGVSGAITSSSATITGGTITGITDLAVADGGTGASTAANARTNLSAAASGANSDITSITGLTTALTVLQGGTGVTTSTGTGNNVLSTSPTLVTPILGTPTSATLTNATGLPVATGVSGLGTGVATALAVNVGSAGAPLVNGGVLGTPSSGTATNLTGLPISTGVSGLGTGVATFLGTPSSANLLAAVSDETGTGALVFANSPTLVTPALGTPSSGTLTNATGLPISTGVSGLGTGVATFLATPSSANLISAVTDETGTGSLVFATSPTLVTPALGTPSALVGTNITGTASGLTAGNVTTNANLTGAITSTGNATSLGSFSSANLLSALTDETGTGVVVFATSPTLVTPILGTPTSATLTNATGLPLTTGVTGQLPVANGGTGTATPSIVAATNVTVTGTWPNQTVAASGGSGTVTSVAATVPSVFSVSGSPITTSGTLAMTYSGTALPVVNGGTGQTSYTDGQLLIGNTTGNTLTKTTLTAGSGVTITNGSGAITIAASGATPAGSNTQVQFNNSGAFGASANLVFDGTNLGVGVTPSASNLPVIQSPQGIFVGNSETNINCNAYYSSGFKYVQTGAATGYRQGSGRHEWYNAVSGTAGNAVSFTTSMVLNANGALSLQGASLSANGVGITFPATQSASSDANTLDDYEEGTWTPAVGGDVTVTYTSRTGTYTKIGNRVVVYFEIRLASISGSGSARVTGLPITPSGQDGDIGTVQIASGGVGFTSAFSAAFSGDTDLYLYTQGATARAGWTSTQLTSSTIFSGTIVYKTA